MSYLQKIMIEKDNNITPPAKDGGISGLQGIKLWGYMGIPIFTIPLFHHSFNLFHKSLNVHTKLVINNAYEICKKECRVNSQLLSGQNTLAVEKNIKLCTEECSQELMGESLHQLETIRTNAENNFNFCLAEQSNKSIEYENILKCKQVAFNYLIDENLKLEQDILTKTLNKFG